MGQLIESLENRRLMAVTTGAYGAFDFQIDGTDHQNSFHVTKRGTLVIKGWDQADTLMVTRRGKVVEMYVDPKNMQLKSVLTDPSIRRVLVEANGGNDIINVAGFDGPATVVGGAGNDRLWCGRGQQLIGGGGNDVLVATGSYNLPVEGDNDGIGELNDKRPSLLSGGAGRDTLVAAAGAPDSLVGGTGADRLFCTANYPDAEAPSGVQAAALLIDQDAVTLSGLETFHMGLRKAMLEAPPGTPDFSSPFGLVGPTLGQT